MQIFFDLHDYFSFVVEIIVSSLFLTWDFKRKKYWYISFIICAILMCLVSYFMNFPRTLDYAFLSGLPFVFIYILIVVMLYFMFEGGIWMAIFCANVGYCFQHLCFNTFSIIDQIPFFKEGLPYYLLHIVWFIIAYTVIFYSLRKFARKKPDIMMESLKFHVSSIIFGGIFIIAATFLDIYLQGYMRIMGTYETDSWMIFLFLMMLTIFILYIQFAILHESKKQTDANRLNMMLSTQKRMYDNNKELIDNINIKCHDLKHQLHAMNGRISTEEADSMAKMVDLYDSNLDTKNESINIILAEKSAICSNRNIKLTCLLDGTHFAKMKSVDLFSLFGNLLDNAIDAVSTLDEEKRYISISESVQGSLINVRVENYCSKRVREFKDGLPQTDKDQRYHGFGTKSIRHLVEKYKGEIFFEQKEQTFIVNMFFDLTELEEINLDD